MKKYLLLIAIAIGAFSCTDLEEELRDKVDGQVAGEVIDVSALLTGSYNGLRLPYMDQSRFWAAQEHTGDAALGPTRGPDWDDNGIWRSLHNHSWSPTHTFLSSTFSELLQVVFSTTNILTPEFGATAEQAAEARFLRAFVMLSVVDGWGQVPFREAGSDLLADAQVLGPQEVVDFIVAECESIIGDLPDGPTHRANKDAAKVLMMKALLNKGAYLNRESPSFDGGDMSKVMTLADEIINSGKYSVATNYFDNFAPNNDQISTENIFTGLNEGGVSSGNIRSRWMCTLHYNQNPSGWNGFTTLFTRNVAIQESGSNLEVTGIRVIKYPIDYNSGDNADNDYVFYRFADVWLMKAEAAMRNGDNGTALDMVNTLRTARGTSELVSIDADGMIAERGRELYWEGHRRTDLIRFGKFLNAWQEKPASGPERLLFPIPATSLASNPNLVQNPGY